MRICVAIAMAAAFVGGIAWLIARPAALERLLPQCVFYRLTHLLCPGCGGTRATSALLHGDLLHALHCNPFTTLAFPVLGMLWLRWAYRIAVGRPRAAWSIRVPASVVYGVAGALTLFMLLRNIPLPAFDFLRPPA